MIDFFQYCLQIHMNQTVTVKHLCLLQSGRKMASLNIFQDITVHKKKKNPNLSELEKRHMELGQISETRNPWIGLTG